MKKQGTPLIMIVLFNVFLLISCATQPIPDNTLKTELVKTELLKTDKLKTEKTVIIIPVPEWENSVERALWNIRNNTHFFQKYITGSDNLLPENGFVNAQDMFVFGEAEIDNNKFRVVYDLINTVYEKNIFRIPFVLENLTDGVCYTDELIWTPAEDISGVLLSLDDDYFSVWRQYFDMFESFGVRVTFFVQGGPKTYVNNLMNLAEFCNEALSRGHDIGFHTVHHYNLLNVSRNVFMNETIEGAKDFINTGISISAFAFPFGLSLPWMRETLSSSFPVIRGYGTNIRVYNLQTIKDGYIVSKAIDNIVYPDNEKFENDIRLMLLAIKFSNNSILPLTTHNISDTAQWGIKISRLEFLLETIRDLKLRFYTYSDIQPF